MENQDNYKILKEIHKGAKMGMDSISYISEKVKDDKLKDELSFQYNQYSDILAKANDEYTKYGKIPDYADLKNQMMSWIGIQMNTANDKSNSKIAEILIQGHTMGIIEGRKLLNNDNQATNDVKQMLNEFVTFQENSVDKLKTYL